VRTAAALTAALLLCAGPGFADDCGFAGTVGWDVYVRPVVPSTLAITSDITLSLSFGGAHVFSRTSLSWLALEAAYLGLGLSFEGLLLTSGMRFDPCLSMYRLEIESTCCPFVIGGLIQLESTAAPCDPPMYSLGLVLDLELWFAGCFWTRSLTGFGVWDVYTLIDDRPETDITLAAGLWLEEQLVGLGYQGACFSGDALALFTPPDLWPTWARFGAAYRWPDPVIELGARLWTLGLSAFESAELRFHIEVLPVIVSSVTTFDLGGFVLQEVYLGVALSGLEVYARAVFDTIGLIVLVVGAQVHL